MIIDFFETDRSIYGREFICLPNKFNPRIIITLKSFKLFSSGSAIHNSTQFKTRVLKKNLKYFYFPLKLLGFLKVYSNTNMDSLEKSIKETIDFEEDIFYSVYVGTNSKNKKLTFQVMNKNGRILGFIKISNSDSVQFIINEYNICNSLRCLDFNHIIIPTLSDPKRFSNYIYTFQNNISSDTSYFGTELNNNLMYSCLEISRIYINDNKEKDLDSISQQAGIIFDTYNLGYLIPELESNLSFIKKANVPLVFIHGDFSPYNIFKKHEKITIIDWEFAKYSGFPLYDLFHFTYQGLFQTYHHSVKYIIKNKILSKKYLQIYYQYLKEMGIVKEAIIPLFKLYLLESLIMDIKLRTDQKIKENHFLKGLQYLVN